LPEAAPDFSLASFDGDTVRLHSALGKNVVLFFGTTWCPHCEAALPMLDSISRVLDGGELEVFFVAVRENATAVTDFIRQYQPSFTILLDESGTVSAQYGVKRIPVCVFIDERGLVLYRGRPNEDILWRLLSGERLVDPDVLDRPIKAAERLQHRRRAARDRTAKRYIVELDEEPWLSKRLPKSIRKTERARFRRIAREIGGHIVHNYGRWKNKLVLEIRPEKVKKLAKLPRFKSVREDRTVHALLEDSAPQIRADYAWDNAVTGQGVKVCVVDTGIDYSHPDLQGKVIAQYNFLTDTEDAMDDNGHGTHCAGIIASEGVTYRGISHDASLMGVKALDYSGNGYASDVILGVNWCVEQGADIISLSLGEGLYTGTCDDDEMAQAVNEAVDAGAVVVCAAGNDGTPNAMVSPACASKAIAVGATDKFDNIASYSDGGSELDLVAPGGGDFGGTNFPEIVSAYSTEVADNPEYCMYLLTEECYDYYLVVEGSRYIRAVGTSMATPHVAAAAALLLEENQHLTPLEVKGVLEQNADDLGAPGWDNIYGWGRINIEKALENMPAEPAELSAKITEPNTADEFTVNEEFALSTEVACFGGDGCGQVQAHVQFCKGQDCNDFVDLDPSTTISTTDENPVELGVLSGYTLETEVPILFDAQTMFDISEASYEKLLNPSDSFVGSELPGRYSTGDLEEQDGIGAIGQDAQELYEFEIPSGAIKSLKVRMEHYLVIHFDYPPFAAWSVYTSNADGENLHLVGDCVPAEGGGGEPPPPDCWFISEDPQVLADLTAGGTNYIKLVSHDVGDNDWLTFNDIEVIVEYEIDPDRDEIYQYYAKFDMNDIEPAHEVTAARLKVDVTTAVEDCTAEVYLADSALLATDSAQAIHEANAPAYSGLPKPIKSFSCEKAGTISLNVETAVEEALAAGQDSVAFQVRQRNNQHLFTVAGGGEQGPRLVISQKVPQGLVEQPPGQEPPESPHNGPRVLTYDTLAVKDVSEDSYAKQDYPSVAIIGAQFPSEYNTGDLEERNGIGAIGENAQQLYEFEIPDGIVKSIKVRMEHYLVLHFDYPPYAAWSVYTSNADGKDLHLIGDCIPAEGGGGEPPPPDCWFISADPHVLADLNPGGTNHIKLVSHDVGDNDWLTFNDIEVIVEYAIDPNNDEVQRYYIKFDVSDIGSDMEIDSGTLSLYALEPAGDAVGEINVVESTYDPETGAYTIYHAEDCAYSNLPNPIKSFACETAGLKQINVGSALEDAVESDVEEIAFLITEQGENNLFAIDGSGSANPPRLDVYLKSSITGATTQWRILPSKDGKYTLRVVADSDVGAKGISDQKVITISDPNLPVINSVDCLINSTWQKCMNARYGDSLRKIRIDATDQQEQPRVQLKLSNVPDDHDFVDEHVPYSDGYFTYDTDLNITDSGQWQIDVTCSDSDGNTDTETITWNIPWGRLKSSLIDPRVDTAVPKGKSFTVRTSLQCLDAECPGAKAMLKLNEPSQLMYDDGSAEDYGELGSIDSYIAVRFTPTSYPAQLKTARFYVWDETTYPFELRVWDDSGPAGAPGTELTEPFAADPVAASSQHEVAWFDIDLTARQIVIEDGSFYIGWRQLEEGKLNQVGFDNTGPRYTRTWGYLPSLGWFNLDEYCQWCDLLPDFCDFCGNIMIRAVLADPGKYQGDLPTATGSAPFYTFDEHPVICPEMNAGQTRDVAFTVNAVGAASEEAKFYAAAFNKYSHDTDGGIEVAIAAAETTCDAANLDAVGQIDFRDFAVLAGQWLLAAPPCSADIDADQSVDMLDVSILAEYWLNNCE
jgi:subtilisin family serine protease